MDLVEAGRAHRHLADDQRRPSITEGLDAGADRAVVGVAGHVDNFLSPPGAAASTKLVLRRRRPVEARAAFRPLLCWFVRRVAVALASTKRPLVTRVAAR